MKMWWLLFSIVLVISVVVVYVGCGGGSVSAGAGTGNVSMTVIFPPPSDGAAPEDLPNATQSVRITLKPVPAGGGEVVVGQAVSDWQIVRLVTAPPGGGPVSALITGVPPGLVAVLAQGFAIPDGTGDVIAMAMTLVLVAAGHTVKANLITQALCASVQVVPPTLALEPTYVGYITATAYDADGMVLLDADFQWSSSDEGVAIVTEGVLPGTSVVAPPTAEVTAVGEGTCTITATETGSGKSAACEVTVTARPVASVTVLPRAITLFLPDDSQRQLTATAYDESGATIPYAEFTWFSTDGSVATVTNMGLAEGVREGYCQIVAYTGEPPVLQQTAGPESSLAQAGYAEGYCDVTVM